MTTARSLRTSDRLIFAVECSSVVKGTEVEVEESKKAAERPEVREASLSAVSRSKVFGDECEAVKISDVSCTSHFSAGERISDVADMPLPLCLREACAPRKASSDVTSASAVWAELRLFSINSSGSSVSVVDVFAADVSVVVRPMQTSMSKIGVSSRHDVNASSIVVQGFAVDRVELFTSKLSEHDRSVKGTVRLP